MTDTDYQSDYRCITSRNHSTIPNSDYHKNCENIIIGFSVKLNP